MTILVALLGLILLVVVHELGHMLVAKAMGVHVPEFGIGFGPAIFKKKIGKTVYSLRIILLGGFAKMEGMEGVASVGEEKGEFGLEPDNPHLLAPVEVGSAEEKREFGPHAYPSKAAWRRALIIFAGPFANLLAAVAILSVISLTMSPPTTKVEQVVPGSLAEDVGLLEGDRIVAANGRPVGEWADFEEALAGERPGDEVVFEVERGGGREEFAGALKADPTNPERAIVGIQPRLSEENYGPVEAVGLGVEQTVRIIGLFGWFIEQLFSGDVKFSEAVSSPIGVVSVSSDVVSQGLLNFAQLLALISINLAVFNLLPILPLDGGHLFFIAAEKVIGRPVRPETIGKVAALGVALILMLFLFATYTDVSKIITGTPFIPEEPQQRP